MPRMVSVAAISTPADPMGCTATPWVPSGRNFMNSGRPEQQGSSGDKVWRDIIVNRRKVASGRNFMA